MNYEAISQRLDDLRQIIHERDEQLTHDQRRQLLDRMERLADRLSYDDSGYGNGQPQPVVPPRHDRLTSPSDQQRAVGEDG